MVSGFNDRNVIYTGVWSDLATTNNIKQLQISGEHQGEVIITSTPPKKMTTAK